MSGCEGRGARQETTSALPSPLLTFRTTYRAARAMGPRGASGRLCFFVVCFFAFAYCLMSLPTHPSRIKVPPLYPAARMSPQRLSPQVGVYVGFD